jgi:hypothetical protein
MVTPQLLCIYCLRNHTSITRPTPAIKAHMHYVKVKE